MQAGLKIESAFLKIVFAGCENANWGSSEKP